MTRILCFPCVILLAVLAHKCQAVKNDTCPMGASIDMDKEELLGTLFPGLFVSKRELRPKLMKKAIASIVESETRRKLNTVSRMMNGETCCEM